MENEALLMQCGAALEDCVVAANTVLFRLNRLFELKEGVSFSMLLEERDSFSSDTATWDLLGRGFIDWPEPDQTYGAVD